MTGPYERPDFPYADKPAEEDKPVRPPYVHCQPQTASTGLRIGDRVRCTALDDPFIDYAVEGVIVNVAPPKPFAAARARILWDTDQVCMMDSFDFEVLPKPNSQPGGAA